MATVQSFIDDKLSSLREELADAEEAYEATNPGGERRSTAFQKTIEDYQLEAKQAYLESDVERLQAQVDMLAEIKALLGA
jgi:hypothetical protein